MTGERALMLAGEWYACRHHAPGLAVMDDPWGDWAYLGETIRITIAGVPGSGLVVGKLGDQAVVAILPTRESSLFATGDEVAS